MHSPIARAFAAAAAFASLAALPSTARAQGTPQTVAVSALTPGAVAFVVDAPGTIHVTVAVPENVQVTLHGASGIVATARGSGKVNVSHEVSASEASAGRVWSAVVSLASRQEANTKADVVVEHPGRQYSPAEMAALPEARAVAQQNAAAMSRLRAMHPPQPPTVATLAMLDHTARTVTGQHGAVNARLINAPAVRTTAQLHGRALVSGVPLSTLQHIGTSVLQQSSFASSGPSSSSSGTSASSAPPPVIAQITGITVTSTDGTGNTSVTPCANALCTIRAGDVLTISGSQFSKLAQQAHLTFITSNEDILANATYWSDNMVVAQVPPSLHGLPVQSGLIWLGTPPNGQQQNASSMYVFDYKRTYTTIPLSFDDKCWPSGTSVALSGSAFFLSFSTGGAGKYLWMDSHSGLPGVGGSGYDYIFPNVVLKNGWMVDSVHFNVQPTGPSSDAFLVQVQRLTPNAEVPIHWWFDAFSGIAYTAEEFVTGEAYTNPYFDGDQPVAQGCAPWAS